MFKFNSRYLTNSISLHYQFPNELNILSSSLTLQSPGTWKIQSRELFNSHCFNQSQQGFYPKVRVGRGRFKQMRLGENGPNSFPLWNLLPVHTRNARLADFLQKLSYTSQVTDVCTEAE